MALYKEIRREDGVVTTYHRVLYVTVTTNSHNSIAVISYTDVEARNSEQSGLMAHPYCKAITYETAYDPSMTIEKAYEYIKSLPEYEGAEDA